ncbi:hypothetical protein K457DRAFT_137782 [Linnemannia elongata AG-77]|uniref:Extracellular membrane protein CFEM domain-containing protein n=1 Tax=Linnemannia elongata AG-77 TaxID=1314771 RepID=A0A197JWA1_9FUNG|nr:hypothetical protein K457DRAFT_137782 [Linnemannia elongata AG-77]
MAAFFKRLRLTALLVIILSLFILTVAAQVTPDPTTAEPTPTPDPSPEVTPSPTDTPSPSETVSGIPTSTSSVPVAPTSTPTPVFTTSTDCIACKPDYNIVSTCVQRIPKTANLTMITQVLPFYQCICPGNMIEALQHCSTCLRSSGQLNFLVPTLYNVTNQQVKAMREVCNTTANGTQTPNGVSGSRLEQLMASASWGAVLSVVVIVVSLGGM